MAKKLPLTLFLAAEDAGWNSQHEKGIPLPLHEHVTGLLGELAETFIRAMRRRGIIIETLDIHWMPDGEPSQMQRKIVDVSRLRAVIETRH
jgi:hypothetical protein